MADHERIWLEPAGAPDRSWCNENVYGEEAVEYVRADLVPPASITGWDIAGDYTPPDRIYVNGLTYVPEPPSPQSKPEDR